jgi:CPA1 family monovalent cation:H+ antiporter
MELTLSRIVGLLVVAIIVAIVSRRLRLPYTVGLVVTGLTLALAPPAADINLTYDVIFDVILPPLLFEAALSIPWAELRRDALPVLTLAVPGVVVSATVVAAGMAYGVGWPVASAVLFGVLIAATDPVSVIAVFKDTGIKGRLLLLAESESLLNDGVAAVLFVIALGWAQAMDHGSQSAAEIARQIAVTSAGGLAVGLSCVPPRQWPARRAGHWRGGTHVRPSGRDRSNRRCGLRIVPARPTPARFRRAGHRDRRIADGQSRHCRPARHLPVAGA